MSSEEWLHRWALIEKEWREGAHGIALYDRAETLLSRMPTSYFTASFLDCEKFKKRKK